MENQAIKVEVNARVWYQDPPLKQGLTSKVVISLSREVEEFCFDESNGSVKSVRIYPSSSPPDPLVSLEFKNFRPSYVYDHVHKQLNDPLLSRPVSDEILVQAQGRDLSQGSLFMIIAVNLTNKEYIVVPFKSCAPSIATIVLDQETTCSICLEDIMLGCKSNPACQLPNCVHWFHEQCLNKWLDREQRSCPLCRQDAENFQDRVHALSVVKILKTSL